MSKLKGTTRIELTNVHTGEKEVHEKHNMVTNALKDIFKPLGYCNYEDALYHTLSPYYATLLGGLLCFDTELGDNPDKYFPPTSASLIGCGVYNVQSAAENPLRGSYNSVESEVNIAERYVKYVYDFGTTQANGTIASICLTHVNGGYTSYGGKNVSSTQTNFPLMNTELFKNNLLNYVVHSKTGSTTSGRTDGVFKGENNEMIFLIDLENDCALYFKNKDGKHLAVTKRRLFLKSLTIFDNVYTTKPLLEEKELPELSGEIKNSCGYNYDPEKNKLYICSSQNNTINSNEMVYIVEIDVETSEVKEYAVTNTSGISLSASSKLSFFVTNGYLYLIANNNTHDVYKFNISNSADVTKMQKKTSWDTGEPSFVVNGRIYYDNSSSEYGFILNTAKNEFLRCEQKKFFSNETYGTGVTPVKNTSLIYFGDKNNISEVGWLVLCNYLATINNLDTPVTKTAEKTMKITYILQEE